MLGTVRDGNPNGLNPSADEEFDTGNGIVTKATILVDIYELDWYSNDNLKGISLGLVVNGELNASDGSTVEISDEKMESYLEVTFSKLASYMHERFNEITKDIPIFVAAYRLDDSNTTGKGGYVYEGYYKGGQGSFTSLKQEWVLVLAHVLKNWIQQLIVNLQLSRKTFQQCFQTTHILLGKLNLSLRS